MINLGLLVFRLFLGLLIAVHGCQKLFGWFDGMGFSNTAGFLSQLGMRPAKLWVFLGGASELGGGLLLALGLLNPLGSIGIIASMIVAITRIHWSNGLWAIKNGYEFALTCLVAALVLGITGPGAYSMDALLKLQLPEPVTFLAGFVVVILGVLIEQFTRVRRTVPVGQVGTAD